MRRIKSGIVSKFPSDVATLQSSVLTNEPYFVQVISVDNIPQPSYDQQGGDKRILRVTMTDGYYKLVGIEYLPFKSWVCPPLRGLSCDYSAAIFCSKRKNFTEF